MSNDVRNTSNPETKGAFVISVDEHEKFDHISDSKFVSSTDFCGLVSQLFNIYADFEGCSYEVVPGTNSHMIALYFNHKLAGTDTVLEDGRGIAITKDAGVSARNNTLRSTRNFLNRYNNGDRFFLTEDAKSGLAPFLFDQNRSLYKANGEVNWDKVVQEVADGNYGMPQQYTKVSFIDPAKVAEMIYGKVDEDGTKWVYGVRVLRSVPTISIGGSNVTTNFMLAIERVCENEVFKLAQSLGVGVNSGLNIIR